MESVRDIFDALGGPAEVARILGVIPSTASEMKRRESIPAWHWTKLLESDQGRACGLSAEILARVSSKQRTA
jgi:hypothetical protein